MKKFNLTLLAVTTCLAASAVSAASIDFREEYKEGQEDWAGRVKISASVGQHFFGVEMKHQGDLGELESGDNEFEYGYKWKLSEDWLLTTSMPITFGSDKVTFKPQARIQYSFENGLVAKFRYRHEFRNSDTEDSAGTKDKDGNYHEHVNRSKFTANLDYKWEAWQFGLEGNYAEDFFNDNWAMGSSSDKDHEWDYNLKVGYKEKGWKWRPYIELGNVQCTSSECDSSRQLRSRVGITYSF